MHPDFTKQRVLLTFQFRDQNIIFIDIGHKFIDSADHILTLFFFVASYFPNLCLKTRDFIQILSDFCSETALHVLIILVPVGNGGQLRFQPCYLFQQRISLLLMLFLLLLERFQQLRLRWQCLNSCGESFVHPLKLLSQFWNVLILLQKLDLEICNFHFVILRVEL